MKAHVFGTIGLAFDIIGTFLVAIDIYKTYAGEQVDWGRKGKQGHIPFNLTSTPLSGRIST